MALTVAGVNHTTAPLDIRERLHASGEAARALLARVREDAGAREAVILSTCNRTELYLVEGERDATPAVWTALSERLGQPAERFGYVRREREAVAHLYRVASGLDSMILGEAQIQGQVRDAWEASRAASGVVLNRLFQSALLVASRVRTETAVARGAASVSSAAVQLAKKIFGSLVGRRAMVLGAGEMAELALECLVNEGVRAAIVANRTYARAQELAERHGATAMTYEECWSGLADVDVLICSTAAPHAVVGRDHIAPALDSRGDRPLCVLDIALPRDVEPVVSELDNVYLYDLDDLRAVAAASIERRRQELPSAEQLIGGEVEMYWTWLAGLSAVPVLKTFRARMDRLREDELAHLLRRHPELSPEERQAVEHFSRALMNKFLHEPSVRLRAAAANGQGLAAVDTLRYLFALEQQTEPAADLPARPQSHDTES
ncbi:MAG TPA: glutamyl-tRNA reductase [Gemmatimonadaceae bacterium]|nr:glutamyl-tRNA reductase [Gemmatimonadaceae bacterium]